MNGSGSHHTWGNLGYWLSARIRVFQHHRLDPGRPQPGQLGRMVLGGHAPLGPEHAARRRGGLRHRGGLPEECEMVVFWSSDPEATSGVYAAFEGTVRRQWLKELGIPMVHIDPYYNHTAALLGGKWLAPRPATGNALALAIAYVWITEELYDKDYVAETDDRASRSGGTTSSARKTASPRRPSGRKRRRASPPRTCGPWRGSGERRRPILPPAASPGSGAPAGARRATSGRAPWSASWPCRGWGNPGVNMGGMQQGTPLDHQLLLPGLRGRAASPGISAGTALAREHVPADAPARHHEHRRRRSVPRLKIPEAILEGRAQGVSHRLQDHRGPVPGFRLPGPRLLACQDVLQVRRLPHRHHVRHEPLRQGVPVREPGIRREPVHLVRGGGEVRGHPAPGLHQLRALGHQRVRQLRRLHPAQLQPVQPPGRGAAAQVHRAPGRIQVGLPDLRWSSPSGWGSMRLILRRGDRARLVQAALRRDGSAQAHLLEGVPEEGVLRRPRASTGG